MSDYKRMIMIQDRFYEVDMRFFTVGFVSLLQIAQRANDDEMMQRAAVALVILAIGFEAYVMAPPSHVPDLCLTITQLAAGVQNAAQSN